MFFMRALAWVAALVILPACWAVSLALASVAPGVFMLSGGASGWLLVPEAWALAVGAIFYLLWHRVRPPEFLYTFAHEMTHLLFALIFFKRVSRLVVGRDSGEVAMSGTNFFITLAPYFFPLLAAVVLGAGMVAEWGLGDERVRLVTSFFTGLGLSFHLTMTLRTLGTSQPDIQRGGRFFSWSVIYLIGTVLAGASALMAAGGTSALSSLYEGLLHEGWAAYLWSGERLLACVRLGVAWAAEF
ncbi:MAG: hypothetical protein HOJ95_04965 [Nitrospinaceae bacterium]|jgi:hypothetical protein|nr:hypothetical protein [Nitrospinaceae bacterium]MBT3432878.1 hypothetical protein [Nitrospinaceae bacterium]MBT5367710.1 hypothetical protein [Nitrospinaceae bacterium]MBT5947578.1 hypothetical protein [Nitrospinaceae bacterium]MBT6394035.1 hypothetical protein [Nitrospinaceae bacterium]